MRARCLVASMSVVVVWMACAPVRVHACECSSEAFARTVPENGAVDISANEPWILEGAFDPATLLVTKADGTPVEIVLNQGPLLNGCPGVWAEVAAPGWPGSFENSTTFIVTADATDPGGAGGEVTFRTGDWGWAEPWPLTETKGSAALLRDVPTLGTSCSSGSVAVCISAGDFEATEVIVRRRPSEDADGGAGEVLMRGMMPSRDFTVLLDEVPDCIELSYRERTGSRSKPVEICGKALGVRAFRGSDANDGALACSNGRFGTDSSSDGVSRDAGSTLRDAGGTPRDTGGVSRDAGGVSLDADGASLDAGGASLDAGGASRDDEGASHDDDGRRQEQYGCSTLAASRCHAAAAYALALFAMALAWRRRRSLN